MRPLILIGLGFGDEGKGSVTDYLVRRFERRLVVRFNGGAQAAHNVIEPNGRHHTFSQFGSGTMAGAKTLLSKHVLFDPLALEHEERTLREIGIADGFSRLYVDARSRVVTPFHVWLNRAREMRRGSEIHGSCGMGIGETVRDSLNRADVLRAGDLKGLGLRQKLASVRDALAPEFDALGVTVPDVDLSGLARRYQAVASKIRVLDSEQVANLLQSESLIFEGAQGVLLDEDFGFHPYTTWSKTTPVNAKEILAEAGVDEMPFTIGVTRTYLTRHGAGPFPTESDEIELRELHNSSHNSQGLFRVGHLDLSLLRYSILASGGIDGIALTHTDRTQQRVCHSYEPSLLWKLPVSLDEQEVMTRSLLNAAPVYREVAASDFSGLISWSTEKPVVIESSGPTWRDKIDRL